MLNTIMALWNHNPAENKYKTIKTLLMLLFVSTSISLLLFAFNGSIWSIFAGGERQITREPHQHDAITTGSGIGTVGSTSALPMFTPTPTPTVIATTRSIQPCMPTPTVIANQNVQIPSHRAVIPAVKEHLGKNKQKYLHPKSVNGKKGRPHATKTPEVRAPITPTPHPTKAAPTVPVETITVEPATPVGTDAPLTLGPNVPDVEVVPAPEASVSTTPTPSFEKYMRNKEVAVISGGQPNLSVRGNMICSTPTPNAR